MLSADACMCPTRRVWDRLGCQACSHVPSHHLSLQGRGLQASCPLGMALPLPCLPNYTPHLAGKRAVGNRLLSDQQTLQQLTSTKNSTPASRSALTWKCKCRQELPCRTAERINGERTEGTDRSNLWWSLGADFAWQLPLYFHAWQ